MTLLNNVNKTTGKHNCSYTTSTATGCILLLIRFLKDANDAEDVVQEAFIKAFSKLHQYKAEVTFGAWLKRIVVNKSIDFLKSKKQKLVELDEVHLKVVDTEDMMTNG